MRDVADYGQQSGIDHCCANAEYDPGDYPGAESTPADDTRQSCRLDHHPACDHPLSAPPVAQCSRPELGDTPGRGINERKYRNVPNRCAAGCEEERKQSPREAVVEVVDQAGLTRAGEGGITPCCTGQELAEAWDRVT